METKWVHFYLSTKSVSIHLATAIDVPLNQEDSISFINLSEQNGDRFSIVFQDPRYLREGIRFFIKIGYNLRSFSIESDEQILIDGSSEIVSGIPAVINYIYSAKIAS